MHRTSLLMAALLLSCDPQPEPTPAPATPSMPTPPPVATDDLASLLPPEPQPPQAHRDAPPLDEATPTPQPPTEATPTPRPSTQATPGLGSSPALSPASGEGATTPASGELVVLRAALAPRLEDREPVGVTDSFAEGARVYCFTKIGNDGGQRRTVRHRWYREGERKASIDLAIRAKAWRTNSNIRVYGKGTWRVDVVDEQGTVLRSLPFTVE